MLELKALDERFEERKVPAYDMSPDKAFPPRISVTAVCEADMKWRLIEESGLESFQEREDGKLVFSSCFSDRSLKPVSFSRRTSSADSEKKAIRI